MYDYLKELNENQLKAVTSTKNKILVLAGAGSGKTKTIFDSESLSSTKTIFIIISIYLLAHFNRNHLTIPPKIQTGNNIHAPVKSIHYSFIIPGKKMMSIHM